VNLRAIGCMTLGAVLFVLVGIVGVNLATSRTGCPDRLQWIDLSYRAEGTPRPSPAAGDGDPVRLGATFVGLTTRDIFGPPGSDPSNAGERPDVIAMACGDGTFVTYRSLRAGASPGASPP
jgi:hypothetical protein